MRSSLLLSVALFFSIVSLKAAEFWEVSQGPPGSVICLASNSRGHIFAGTANDALFRSTDYGATWERKYEGLPGMGYDKPVMAIVVGADDNLYIAQKGNGVFRSTNNGDTWTDIGSTLPSKEVRSIAIRNRGAGEPRLAIGIDGGSGMTKMFLTDDRGTTWTEQALPGVQYQGLFEVALSPNSNKMWCSIGYNKGIFRLDPDGVNFWRRIDNPSNTVEPGESDDNFRVIRFDHQGNMFLGRNALATSSKIQNAVVMMSTDDGESWKYLKGGDWKQEYVINCHITGIAFGKPGEIVATTDKSGTYYSNDNGDTWIVRNEGLPGDGSCAAAVGTVGNHFYVAPYGDFIHHHLDPSTSVNETIPGVVRVENASPNPAADRFSIPMTLDRPMDVTVRLVNANGMEVVEPFTSTLGAGTHRVSFSTAGLVSGMYSYRMQVGGLVRTGSVAVVR